MEQQFPYSIVLFDFAYFLWVSLKMMKDIAG